jgi:hypothetical protein
MATNTSAAALMNAGPIIHPPVITMNAGPLEHFEAWDIHNEGTQPAIRRVTDRLDVGVAIPFIWLDLSGERINTYRGSEFVQAQGWALEEAHVYRDEGYSFIYVDV